nr:MAG TPA: hypothetical protein [Caudoviricetes sp.]
MVIWFFEISVEFKISNLTPISYPPLFIDSIVRIS